MHENLQRIDKVLVETGRFDSRASAQAAIAAGKVKVDGRVVTKASEKVAPSATIEAQAEHPWVSRAGLKLEHALEVFDVDPSGWLCLDVGASTGGFTDVLLAHGASSVVSVDVGRDQLHPRLRRDARVTSLESTDARMLTPEMLGAPPRLIVCDASFISLHKLLSGPLSLASHDAILIALFKPQFEVGRENVGKGGIVTNTKATEQAEETFIAWLAEQGWRVCARTDSPIRGGDGNAERLIHAVRSDESISQSA
jgi:23S rRNA (cytidine1920-2'-O)/16S rRNA (cytidine1409-2'-O)-methyltransferase